MLKDNFQADDTLRSILEWKKRNSPVFRGIVMSKITLEGCDIPATDIVAAYTKKQQYIHTLNNQTSSIGP
jgi:hypothetical protein